MFSAYLYIFAVSYETEKENAWSPDILTEAKLLKG